MFLTPPRGGRLQSERRHGCHGLWFEIAARSFSMRECQNFLTHQGHVSTKSDTALVS